MLKENSEFKAALLSLKVILYHILLVAEGLGTVIYPNCEH